MGRVRSGARALALALLATLALAAADVKSPPAKTAPAKAAPAKTAPAKAPPAKATPAKSAPVPVPSPPVVETPVDDKEASSDYTMDEYNDDSAYSDCADQFRFLSLGMPSMALFFRMVFASWTPSASDFLRCCFADGYSSDFDYTALEDSAYFDWFADETSTEWTSSDVPMGERGRNREI